MHVANNIFHDKCRYSLNINMNTNQGRYKNRKLLIRDSLQNDSVMKQPFESFKRRMYKYKFILVLLNLLCKDFCLILE